MSFAFDPRRGLIVIQTEVFGPRSNAVLRLALDTGATRALIDAGALTAIGYDVAGAPDRVQVTTGSGIASSARIKIERLVALGQERQAFSVVSHQLPSTLSVEGVLGLDFLRGQTLTIDFRSGQIALS